MSTLEVLECVRSLVALRLKAPKAEPAEYAVGYARGVEGCLETLDALIAAEKRA